ncbi:MAG TPA: hypothetical protein VK453_25490 [Micromonosporaceae bacterium]|nr:hypothetical protein [Micromonosporaceae bacterium]
MEISITIDGRPAHTTEQAAKILGLEPEALRQRIRRRRAAGDPVSPAGHLDARTPLYWIEDLQPKEPAR